VDAQAALELLNGVTDLFVAKGKKSLHIDLRAERPSDEDLLKLMLGRSGTLRAPTLKSGKRLIVGFNADILQDTLLR
jgi:arsenate reductase-like glutaredoxin family protein